MNCPRRFLHTVCEYYRSGVLLLGVKIYQTLCCSLETTLRSPPPLAARSLVAHSLLHVGDEIGHGRLPFLSLGIQLGAHGLLVQPEDTSTDAQSASPILSDMDYDLFRSLTAL